MTDGLKSVLVMLRILFGLALVAALAAGALVLSCGRIAWAFFDPPSVVIVLGLLVGGLWVGFGPVMVAKAVWAVFSEQSTVVRQAYPVYVQVFSRAIQLAWAAGMLGTLIGSVILLQNMSDPSYLGAGFSIALLTLLYGGFLAEFILVPLRQVLVNRAIRHEIEISGENGAERWRVVIGGAVFAIAVTLLLLFARTFVLR